MNEPKRSVEDDIIDGFNYEDAYWQSVFDVDFEVDESQEDA